MSSLTHFREAKAKLRPGACHFFSKEMRNGSSCKLYSCVGAHWSVTVQQTTNTGLLLLLKVHMKDLTLWRGRTQFPMSSKPWSWPQLIPGLDHHHLTSLSVPCKLKKTCYISFCCELRIQVSRKQFTLPFI